jgi:hypothetical protein
MDDLKFRRRILSEPKLRDQEINQAINSSNANRKYAEEILQLDAEIESALNVEVPDGLAERILFSQTAEPEKRRFSRSLMAIAASVAFAAGILVGQINWSPLLITPAYANLEETAVKHVTHEMPFINPLDEQATSEQINAKLQPFTYQFTESFPYHVYYLNHCGFGPSNALHMVFQGDKGKVTLFITNIQSDDQVDFNKNGLSGIVVPIKDSSLILVGEEDEDLGKLASQLSAILRPAS